LGLQGHKQNQSQLHAFRAQLKKLVTREQHGKYADMLDAVNSNLIYSKSQHGLAVYSDGTRFWAYALPFSPELFINVGNKLILDQLVEYYKTNQQYYVLAISKNGSHLYAGDKDTMSIVPVKGLGQNIETTLRIDEKQSHILQNHPVGAGGGKNSEGFHGHGGFKDMKKVLFEEYLRVVDKLVTKTIKNNKSPLVIVAVGYAQSAYKHVSKYPNILVKSVSTNPDDLTALQLHDKTLPLLG